MKPVEYKRFASFAITNHRPFIVSSGPGTGKTVMTCQVAAELGFEVPPPLYLGMLDPVDVGGMNLPTQPDANGKRRLERLLDDWLEPAFTATKPTLLLLDEVDKGTHAVQCAVSPIYDARRCGKHKLPACVSVVGTGNRREHRAGSVNTLTHILARTARISLEVDPLAWIDRAIEDKVASEIVSFIKQYPSCLDVSLRPNKEKAFEEIYQSGLPFENPRSWYMISSYLKDGLDNLLENEVFEGIIGQGVNMLLQPHLLLVRTSVDIQAIMAGQGWKFPPKEKIGAQYAFVIGVGACANKDTADRVIEIALELYGMKEREHAMVVVQTAAKAYRDLSSTPAWMDVLRKHPLGQSIRDARRV